MAGTPIPSANIDASKQDVIAAIVQKEIAGEAKFLPLVSDFSRFVGKGMKTFSILKKSVVTAADLDCTIDNPTLAYQLDQDTMTLDKLPYVSFVICEPDNIESVLDLEAESARTAGSAIARHIDDSIITALAAGAGYSAVTDGAFSADLGRDQILAMLEYAECNHADFDSLVIVGSCRDKYQDLLKEASFTENQVYGSPVIQNGQIGSLYGVPLMVSSRVPTGEAYVFSRDAIAYAAQREILFDRSKCPERGAGAVRLTWDGKYGVQILQENQGGAGVGKSPWIAKLQA